MDLSKGLSFIMVNGHVYKYDEGTVDSVIIQHSKKSSIIMINSNGNRDVYSNDSLDKVVSNN